MRAESPVNQSVRRFIYALLLAICVYGAFVAYTGYNDLRLALRDFAWRSFFGALGLASANYLLRFAKWEFYLARLGIRGIPRLESLLVFLSGFVLTVTPGKVGEVFKSAVLSETHGIDAARTAPIVVAERLTDVIAIVALIVFGSLGFSGGLLWALAGSVAVAIGLLLILWRRPVEALLRWLGSRGERLRALVPRLETAYASLRVVASPSALLIPTLLSIVGWGAEGFALWLLLDGFGFAPAIPLALFFYSTATLAGALIPLPGGLGITEAMFQSQLVELGHVPQAPATAAMLMIRFATLWWAVVVGFVALGLLRLRFPKLLALPGTEEREAR